MPDDLLSQHLKLLARGWPMLDYFALPAVLFFVLAGFVAIAVRWRRHTPAARFVRELHPVSQHWLADFRRSG